MSTGFLDRRTFFSDGPEREHVSGASCAQRASFSAPPRCRHRAFCRAARHMPDCSTRGPFQKKRSEKGTQSFEESVKNSENPFEIDLFLGYTDIVHIKVIPFILFFPSYRPAADRTTEHTGTQRTRSAEKRGRRWRRRSAGTKRESTYAT